MSRPAEQENHFVSFFLLTFRPAGLKSIAFCVHLQFLIVSPFFLFNFLLLSVYFLMTYSYRSIFCIFSLNSSIWATRYMVDFDLRISLGYEDRDVLGWHTASSAAPNAVDNRDSIKPSSLLHNFNRCLFSCIFSPFVLSLLLNGFFFAFVFLRSIFILDCIRSWELLLSSLLSPPLLVSANWNSQSNILDELTRLKVSLTFIACFLPHNLGREKYCFNFCFCSCRIENG